MKIMTYNIKNDYKLILSSKDRNKINDITELINEYNLDIIGLQEISQRTIKKYQNKLKDYIFIGNHRKSGYLSNEYNIILVKNNIEIKEYSTYSLSNNTSDLGNKLENHNYPRIATFCHINYDNNDYLVINTHLDNSKDTLRNEELQILNQLIKEELDNEYLIVLGDFNMGDNKYLKAFRKSYDLEDVTEHLGATYSSLNKSLDHILLSNDLYCDYKEKLITDYSDHYPLIASFSIKTKK